MPSTPYSKLLVSVNAGATQSGGITVSPGDTLTFSAESTVGWPGNPAPRFEIYGYPVGFTEPSGWSTDGVSGAYYYLGTTPPSVIVPAIEFWGKFMLSLIVGGRLDLTDTSTCFQTVSANGIIDLGTRETNQFGVGWDEDHRANLRQIDGAVTDALAAASGATSRLPVKGVATSNHALTGAVTTDGVSFSTGDRILLPVQTDATENGVYSVNTGGAWSRSTDANTSPLMTPGLNIYSQNGTLNKGAEFILVTPGPIVLDTTELRFIRKVPEVDAKIFANGDGTTNDATNLHTAGLASATVRYTPATYAITSGVTLGFANASTHEFLRGAAFDITDAAVVIRGQVKAPVDVQIFFLHGTATISLPDMTDVPAAWFGASPDSGDNTDAIASAIASIPHGVVHLGAGTYLCTQDNVLVLDDLKALVGVGRTATVLSLACTSDVGLTIATTTGLNSFQLLQGLTITAPSATHYAVLIKGGPTDAGPFCYTVKVQDVVFDYCAAGAIDASGVVINTTFDGCSFLDSCIGTTTPVVRLVSSLMTATKFVRCDFTNNSNQPTGRALYVGTAEGVWITDCIFESSGKPIFCAVPGSVYLQGCHFEGCYSPFVETNHTDPTYWGGAIVARSCSFSPIGTAASTCFRLSGGSSIDVDDCTFYTFADNELLLDNQSCVEDSVHIGKGNAAFFCSPAFESQLRPRDLMRNEWTNLALHSDYGDASHASVTSGSGATCTRDTSNTIFNDTASQKIAWADGATALVKLDSSQITISNGEIVFSFWAWISAAATIESGVSASSSTDRITFSGTPPSATTPIYLTSSGGSVPSPFIPEETLYPVSVNVGAKTIQVSRYPNGAAVDLTTSGSGTLVVHGAKYAVFTAIVTGTAQTNAVRLEVDDVPRLYTIRAVPPIGGGTYSLSIQAPYTLAYPGSQGYAFDLNIARLSVGTLPRGGPIAVPPPFVRTVGSSRTIQAPSGTDFYRDVDTAVSAAAAPFRVDGVLRAELYASVYALVTSLGASGFIVDAAGAFWDLRNAVLGYLDADSIVMRTRAQAPHGYWTRDAGTGNTTLTTPNGAVVIAKDSFEVRTGGTVDGSGVNSGSTQAISVTATQDVAIKGQPVMAGPSVTFTLGVTAIGVGGHVDATVAISGAVFGTDIALMSPITTPDAAVTWCAWVSANDVVTIRVSSIAGLTTTSTDYTVRVIKQ